MRYIPYIFSILLAGLGYWVGVQRTENSFAAERVRIQNKLFVANNDLFIANQKLEELQSAQTKRAANIEAEIRMDPNTKRPGIGSDGLLRLERRWRLEY